MDEQKTDEQKSWKRLIAAYAGAGALVVAIAVVIARGASSNAMIVAHAGATSTPNVVGVYSGIAPDATPVPKPAATDAPSPSPAPSRSATPAPHPSKAADDTKKTVAKAEPARAAHKSAARHAKMTVADASANATGDANGAGHIVPIEHTSAQQDVAPKAVQSEAPVVVEQATEAAAPAPAPATEAPQSNEPIFAPQRIVDAQMRVAVQPDISEVDRERGAHGTSIVLVTIDPKGNVVNAVVGSSSGYSSLDRAAMTAARSSSFVAPKINGRPATETYRVVYDFSQ